MSQQSFADLGVSRAVAGALAERGITEPFAIQQLVIADVLAGHDVLAKSPTGSGKTIAFGAPIADRIEANDRRPAALILAPTRELASQIVEDIRPLAHARALKIAAVYGGVGIVKQARAAAQRPHRRGHPRSPGGPPPARRPDPRPRAHPRPRRGRPHARHGLQARGRPHRGPVPAPSARRCSSRPRSTARPAAWPRASRTTPAATSTRRRSAARPRSSTASSPSSATSASTRCSASCAASATWRSSSCAPSAASTGWSSA